jgi:hypothetical protein
MKNITGNIVPWSVGTFMALGGVAVARLLAPSMETGSPQILVTVTGRLIAMAGLCVILFGIHRRIRGEQIDTPSSAKDHSA